MLKDASGKEVGRATLTSTPSGVLMNLDADRASARRCTPSIFMRSANASRPNFKSAGPHFNPDQTKHGMMNPEGPHAGDMPNLHVPAAASSRSRCSNPSVTSDAEAALLDDDGSAIVIHAGADDYKTDPAGNAGDRIACGVITALSRSLNLQRRHARLVPAIHVFSFGVGCPALRPGMTGQAGLGRGKAPMIAPGPPLAL